MKNYFYIIILLFIISCDESSDIISKNIEVSEFNKIYVNDIFDINLIQDSICKIEVIAESNLIPKLEFNVNVDKKLSVYNKNTARWTNNYERILLNIHFSDLEDITLNRPSKVYSTDTIRCNSLLIHALAEFSEVDLLVNADRIHFANSQISGGLYNLKGKTKKITAWIRGSGQFNADELRVDYIYLRNSSIGDCYVYAVDELVVMFENTGLIYFKGDPIIEVETPEFENQLIKLKN